MDTPSLHSHDHDADDRHHLGSNINSQGPCGLQLILMEALRTQYPYFHFTDEETEAQRVWKDVSGGWGVVTIFQALLFDTTLSHHIPGFLGSMVPMLYDLYRQKSFSEIFLGCTPWV